MVVIDAFEPTDAAPEHVEAANLLTEELVLELGRYRFVRALLQREVEHLEPSRRTRVRFSLKVYLHAKACRGPTRPPSPHGKVLPNDERPLLCHP